jgi:hypothetical protein
VAENLRALGVLEFYLNDPPEQLIINLVCSYLYPETRKTYRSTLVPQDLAKYETMMTFLAQSCHTNESIETYKPTPPKVNTKLAPSAYHSGHSKSKAQFHKSNTFVASGTPENLPKA